MILALIAILMDGLVSIPAGQWTPLRFKTTEPNTIVQYTYEVKSGSRIQAMLYTPEEASKFNRGRRSKPLQISGFFAKQRGRVLVSSPGEYVLFLDNRFETAGAAQVSVRVETVERRARTVIELPADKRRQVIVLSLLFFGAVLVFSAWQFLKKAQYRA